MPQVRSIPCFSSFLSSPVISIADGEDKCYLLDKWSGAQYTFDVCRRRIHGKGEKTTVVLTRCIAEALLEQGTYTTWAEDTVSHAELKRLLC
jgi:hypothetical protein